MLPDREPLCCNILISGSAHQIRLCAVLIRFVGIVAMNHFICFVVILDLFETSDTKKYIRNEFFRRFCVDPCGSDFFLARKKIGKTEWQKNLNLFRDIHPVLLERPFKSTFFSLILSVGRPNLLDFHGCSICHEFTRETVFEHRQNMSRVSFSRKTRFCQQKTSLKLLYW